MEGDQKGYKKGLWAEEEDRVLMEYVRVHGKGRWNRVAQTTGLKRCGKSCRLRWINYLSPSIKHGDFSEEEDDLIIRLHNLLGNRWSLIAGRVPGRTDNQVKNHWNTHLSKKLGIRKRIRTKVNGVSSRTMPKKVAAGNSITPLDTNFMHSSESNNTNGAKGQNVIEGGFRSNAGFFEVDEPMVNESCESPFWIYDHLDAPSLLGLFNQFSPDFVWHGL
ncbi:hypothetical protein RHSIM_Rhsim08G0171500 [Rhododendron simsii]|uniref:Uncharacterized protein n=1 Tax=Rhododendron simsii TaxID=118357 RepID=A0A834LH81_RHOSS|nr:hypothetical protein RHSIM_Rhsim08G0171500 [Rhododendron simsii]